MGVAVLPDASFDSRVKMHSHDVGAARSAPVLRVLNPRDTQLRTRFVKRASAPLLLLGEFW